MGKSLRAINFFILTLKKKGRKNVILTSFFVLAPHSRCPYLPNPGVRITSYKAWPLSLTQQPTLVHAVYIRHVHAGGGGGGGPPPKKLKLPGPNAGGGGGG